MSIFVASEMAKKHTTQSGSIRDPSSALPMAYQIESIKLVILGGLAELFAGSISMRLGPYLATITDVHHFRIEGAREQCQAIGTPQFEEDMLVAIFIKYSPSREELLPILWSFRQSVKSWFMMDFELKPERPTYRYTALITPSAITAVMLSIFGHFKSVLTRLGYYSALCGSLATLFVGGVAAGVSFGIVRVVNKGFEIP
ncbi:hypothetical protein DER46DRAFT_626804 [Fusarium sp. MPI-SDFR-AT-0072]|nr:hypothetical protein DER46DRAFT_626804 [Fusarium sp. MPI-SDFR-AT-0072]